MTKLRLIEDGQASLADGREAAAIEDPPNSEPGLAELVGTHENFLREIAKIPLAARSDAEVLITGVEQWVG